MPNEPILTELLETMKRIEEKIDTLPKEEDLNTNLEDLYTTLNNRLNEKFIAIDKKLDDLESTVIAWGN